MSCCGSRRVASRQAPGTGTRGEAAHWATGPRAFTYAGPGRLTVTGPLTGAIYHFSARGGPVAVHAADVASLAAVPGLRAVG